MRTLLFIMSLLFAQLNLAAEVKLQPKDFAYGITIQAGDGNSIQRIQLPLAVYEGLTHNDLGDMRIFNSSGEIINYQLKPTSMEQEERQYSLVYFPIYSDKPDGQSINLKFARADDGSILVKKSQMPAQNKQLTAFLIDTRFIKDKQLGGLTFLWVNDNKTWIYSLKVSASNDLQNWTTLPVSASVAQLNYEHNRIIQNTLTINRIPYNYLLVSADKPLDFQLQQLYATTVNRSKPHEWYQVKKIVNNPKTSDYELQSPNGLPISALEISFGKQAYAAQVAIYSRAQSSEPWQYRTKANIYSLVMDKHPLINQQIHLLPTRDHYWLIKILNASSTDNRVPSVKLGWQPDELYFVADGNSPYTLAYGSRNPAVNNSYQQADILSEINSLQNLSIAKLSKPFILGGDAALKKSGIEINYQVVILWTLLLLGVGIIAKMVFLLWHQTRNNG